MANKKRAFPRLPVENENQQLWWNPWTSTTTPETYNALWVTETWEHSNSLLNFETYGLPTTLNEIDNLCWNEHGTIAAVSLDKEQAPSAGHKTTPNDKTRIRGKNPSGRGNEKYDFNPLETAWKQVGNTKKETNQYITTPNSTKILRTKRPPQG